MKIPRTLHGVAPVILAAGLCMTASALADELPTITIGAGVMTKSVVGRSASTGAPIEQVTVSHRVSYADLDLATQTGAAALEQRVKETAVAACKQLDRLYPLEAKNERECTSAAIAQASPQVENAIAAARREAKAD